MKDRYRKLVSAYLLATILSFAGLTVAAKYLISHFEERDISWPQALLYVVETMTTVGYGSLLPFNHWVTLIFTSVVILIGFTLIFVGLSGAAAHYLSEHFQERPPAAAPPDISDHIIICDYNPLVESLTQELGRLAIPFVIVETDRELVNELTRRGVTCILGEPGETETLQAARIGHARALVADHSDAENASIVLTARGISDLEIYATAEHFQNGKYLQLAGATQVISPKRVLGENLAHWVISSTPDELIKLAARIGGLGVTQLTLSPGSALAGSSLRELKLREKTGVSVIGYWYRGSFRLVPSPDEKLPSNSALVLVGTHDQFENLLAFANSTGRPVRSSPGPSLIAGYGDVGRRVAQVLEENGVDVSIITNSAGATAYPTIRGDATDESILMQADIAGASTYIVALDQDSNAVFTTLIARQLNPELRIVARANSQGAVADLYRAGADHVLSVSEVGGSMLAKLLLPESAPEVTAKIAFGKLEVRKPLSDKTIAGARLSSDSGCLAVALIREGNPVINPNPATVLRPGDELVLCGPARCLAHCGCQEVFGPDPRGVS